MKWFQSYRAVRHFSLYMTLFVCTLSFLHNLHLGTWLPQSAMTQSCILPITPSGASVKVSSLTFAWLYLWIAKCYAGIQEQGWHWDFDCPQSPVYIPIQPRIVLPDRETLFISKREHSYNMAALFRVSLCQVTRVRVGIEVVGGDGGGVDTSCILSFYPFFFSSLSPDVCSQKASYFCMGVTDIVLCRRRGVSPPMVCQALWS